MTSYHVQKVNLRSVIKNIIDFNRIGFSLLSVAFYFIYSSY